MTSWHIYITVFHGVSHEEAYGMDRELHVVPYTAYQVYPSGQLRHSTEKAMIEPFLILPPSNPDPIRSPKCGTRSVPCSVFSDGAVATTMDRSVRGVNCDAHRVTVVYVMGSSMNYGVGHCMPGVRGACFMLGKCVLTMGFLSCKCRRK